MSSVSKPGSRGGMEECSTQLVLNQLARLGTCIRSFRVKCTVSCGRSPSSIAACESPPSWSACSVPATLSLIFLEHALTCLRAFVVAVPTSCRNLRLHSRPSFRSLFTYSHNRKAFKHHPLENSNPVSLTHTLPITLI